MKGVYPWQKTQWAKLENARRKGRFPHALLLTGTRGMGKLDFARTLARAWLCRYRDREGFACGECDACVQFEADTHPDFMQVSPEKAGGVITVDKARAVGEFLTLKSHHGRGRVVLLVPAEAMNSAAANSLLKTLEEPPPGTLMILVTDGPGLLLATIRSRCQRLGFVPEWEAAGRWLKERLGKGDGDPDLLLRLAGGAPLRALQWHEEGVMSRRARLFEDFEGIAREQEDPVVAAERWYEQEQVGEVLFWLDSWLMDMIRLKQTAASAGVVNADVAERLRALAEDCEEEPLFFLLERVTKAMAQLRRSLNRQLLLEELFVVWGQVAQVREKRSISG